MRNRTFYFATLIPLVVILYASRVGFFWAVMILVATILHAMALVLAEPSCGWKE